MAAYSGYWASQVALVGKEPTCQCRRLERCEFNPWVGKNPWRRAQPPTPVLLLGESHGQRILDGYSPQSCRKSDLTKRLSTHIIRASLVAQTINSLPAMQKTVFDPWVGKILWSRAWQPTPVVLPGESYGQRSLAGYHPWGCKESDTAERLTPSGE